MGKTRTQSAETLTESILNVLGVLYGNRGVPLSRGYISKKVAMTKRGVRCTLNFLEKVGAIQSVQVDSPDSPTKKATLYEAAGRATRIEKNGIYLEIGRRE